MLKELECDQCKKIVKLRAKEYVINLSDGKKNDILKIREYYCAECNRCLKAEEFGEGVEEIEEEDSTT